MDNLKDARIRELCGVTKGVDERIDEGVFRWFGRWREWRMIGFLRESM